MCIRDSIYIFLAGIAAGIKDVAIGDVVVGTKAYGYELGKETKEGFLSRPQAIEFSPNLINVAKQLLRGNDKQPYIVKFGPIAGGNKVINDEKGVLAIIKKHYNDTIALEMESIGFAAAATKTETFFLNIRGISDLALNKKDDFQAIAAQRLSLIHI